MLPPPENAVKVRIARTAALSFAGKSHRNFPIRDFFSCPFISLAGTLFRGRATLTEGAEFMASVGIKSSKGQNQPTTLRELRLSGWRSKGVKREMYDNFMRMLAGKEELFPGIIGYDDTVVPEINLGLIAQHDMLFLGEKG